MLLGFAAWIVASFALFAAPTVQERSTQPELAAALKEWVSCLHTEAKRAKETGVATDPAVDSAYAKCGEGNDSLDKAIAVLESTTKFTASEKATLREGAKASIRKQVLADLTELPAFTFRELIAGRDFDMNSPGFKRCDKKPNGVTCTELFDNVGGVSVITSYTIYNRKLSQFWISTERDNLPTLLLAFTEKYGAPCKKETKAVQNRAGATFQSTEMTWCFKTGKMIASEIGPRITHSSIIYTDEVYGPPAQQPTVDF